VITDPNLYWIRDLKVSGTRLYVSNQSDGTGGTIPDSVTAYDISTPQSPSKISQFLSARTSDDEGYQTMEVYNDRFVLVTVPGANVIDVIDFDNLSTPALDQTIGGSSNDPSLQFVNDLQVIGNRLYTLSKHGESINTYSLASSTAPGGGGGGSGGGGGGSTPSGPAPSVPGAPNTGMAKFGQELRIAAFIIAASMAIVVGYRAVRQRIR